MQTSTLRTALLWANLGFALWGCSLFDGGGHASPAGGAPIFQQGSSDSPPAINPPPAQAWPGPNVGAPTPLTGPAAASGGTNVAANGGPSGIAGVPLPPPPGSEGFSGGTTPPAGLVDVDLNKVRRHVARYLNVDAGRIPATMTLPATVAANLCGIDVNALATQPRAGGGKPTCVANNVNMATDVVEPTIQ
jgi:hypothetical protein